MTLSKHARGSMMATIFVATVLLVLGVHSQVSFSQSMVDVSIIQPGNTVDADLQLVALDGQNHNVLSPDRATLLYFSNMNCRYCFSFEESILRQVPRELGFQLSMIVVGATEEEIRAHYHDFEGGDIRVFYGTSALRHMFSLAGTPAYVLLKPSGEVLWSQLGYDRSWNPESFIALISRTMEQKSTDP